jgi:hypothetical protein
MVSGRVGRVGAAGTGHVTSLVDSALGKYLHFCRSTGAAVFINLFSKNLSFLPSLSKVSVDMPPFHLKSHCYLVGCHFVVVRLYTLMIN